MGYRKSHQRELRLGVSIQRRGAREGGWDKPLQNGGLYITPRESAAEALNACSRQSQFPSSSKCAYKRCMKYLFGKSVYDVNQDMTSPCFHTLSLLFHAFTLVIPAQRASSR